MQGPTKRFFRDWSGLGLAIGLLGAAVLLSQCTDAHAEAAGGFTPTGQVAVAASTSSGATAVQLGSAGPIVVIKNTGSVSAEFALGGPGVVATTALYPIDAGDKECYQIGNGASVPYIAAITASGTTSLAVTSGSGSCPSIAASGGGSSLTNYALESGGNLANLAAQIAKLNFSGIYLQTVDQNSAAELAAMQGGIPTQAPTVDIGAVGISHTTPGATDKIIVGALATGGATPFHLASSAASNNATLVSTGAHTLYSLVIFTTSTSIADVRIYDASGSPTCSSSTGVVLNLPVQAVSGAVGGVAVPIPAQGMVLANGLAYCVTGAVADNDNTNAPTGVGIGGLYK